MRSAKLLQKSTLFDSKFMLFVDDRKVKIGKSDIFLNDGMRPDDKVDMSVTECLLGFFFLCWSEGASQKLDPHAQGKENFGK